MKARIDFMRHHLLKAAVPVAAASMVASDIRGRSWVLDTGSLVGMLVAFALFLAALGHARKAHACERCIPKSADVLKRPLYRAWKKYSDWGIVPPVIYVAATVISMPLMFEKGTGRESQFNWGPSLSIISMFLVIALHVATVRFRRVNHPGAGIWNPVRSFIDGQGRGQWLRHNGHWVVVGMAVVVSVTSFTPVSGGWGAAQSVIFVGFLLAAYANHRHSMSLCEQCVTEFRTDAPEYAAQRTGRFRVAHRYGWFPMVVTLGLMGSDAFVDAPYDLYFMPVSFGLIACFTLLERFHCSYQPWCPYCHGGGGGGGHAEAVPDPSGGHGRPLPVA
jgi:hypothetical protein